MVEDWLASQRYYTLELLILHRTGLTACSPHSFPDQVPALLPGLC
jgi:hypothetical protein